MQLGQIQRLDTEAAERILRVSAHDSAGEIGGPAWIPDRPNFVATKKGIRVSFKTFQ